LEFKRKDKELYIYLKEIYKLEGVIGTAVRELAARPNIMLKYPLGEKDWESYIYKKGSIFEKRDPEKYRKLDALSCMVVSARIDWSIDQHH